MIKYIKIKKIINQMKKIKKQKTMMMVAEKLYIDIQIYNNTQSSSQQQIIRKQVEYNQIYQIQHKIKVQNKNFKNSFQVKIRKQYLLQHGVQIQQQDQLMQVVKMQQNYIQKNKMEFIFLIKIIMLANLYRKNGYKCLKIDMKICQFLKTYQKGKIINQWEFQAKTNHYHKLNLKHNQNGQNTCLQHQGKKQVQIKQIIPNLIQYQVDKTLLNHKHNKDFIHKKIIIYIEEILKIQQKIFKLDQICNQQTIFHNKNLLIEHLINNLGKIHSLKVKKVLNLLKKILIIIVIIIILQKSYLILIKVNFKVILPIMGKIQLYQDLKMINLNQKMILVYQKDNYQKIQKNMIMMVLRKSKRKYIIDKIQINIILKIKFYNYSYFII